MRKTSGSDTIYIYMFNPQTYVSLYNSLSVQLGMSMDQYGNRVLKPLLEWWAMHNATLLPIYIHRVLNRIEMWEHTGIYVQSADVHIYVYIFCFSLTKGQCSKR